METIEITYLSVVVALPFLDLIRVYATNMFGNRQKRNQHEFYLIQEDLIYDKCKIAFKLWQIILLISGNLIYLTLLLLELDKYAKFILISRLASLGLRIQYIFLLTYDIRYYGLTTPNTRINFFICLLSELILSWRVQLNSICDIVQYTGTFFILITFLLINFSPKDYLLKAEVIDRYHRKQILKRKAQSIANQYTVNSYVKSGFKSNNDSVFDTTQDDIQRFNIQDEELIQNIQIQTFKESEKYEKKTIIYQIDYRLNNKPRIVYRSFREFISFNSDLRQANPHILLPLFPSMKVSRFLSMDDIQQRQQTLDTFLKGILVRFNQHEYLRQFLNSSNDTMQYKQKHLPDQKQKMYQSQESKARSRSKYTAMIPETIFEGLMDDDDESMTDERRDKKIARSHGLKQSIFSNPQNGEGSVEEIHIHPKSFEDNDYEKLIPHRYSFRDQREQLITREMMRDHDKNFKSAIL